MEYVSPTNKYTQNILNKISKNIGGNLSFYDIQYCIK